jgi:hypothetical protein
VLLYQLPYVLKQPRTKKVKKSRKPVETTLVTSVIARRSSWADKSRVVVGVTAGLLKELPKEAGAKRKRPTARKRECGSARVNLTEEVKLLVSFYHVATQWL